MQNEKFYVNCWRYRAVESLGWGQAAEWSDLDFEKLSNLFLERTGTLLSITTLKRLFGKVQYNSTPNAATLNALGKFFGYEDWRAFKLNVDGEAEGGNQLPAAQKPVKKPQRVVAVLSVVAVVVFLGLIVSWSSNKPQTKAKRAVTNVPVKFSSRKVTDGVPNSVVFDYDASGLDFDSVTLQQSWDPSRTEELSADKKQHTSIYYYPGYFTAKLIANGQIRKETPVYIKTNGWLGMIDKIPVPAYLSDNEMHLPGAMGITSKMLSAKTGMPVFNRQMVSFYNVREFDGLNGGDFTLETTIRNASTTQESACRKAVLYVLGKQNAIVIQLAERGCVSDLNIYTSSEWLKGRDVDLSAFGTDLSKFQKLTCTVKDMQLHITLAGSEIFSRAISQTIGDIAGICISFEGAGEIKDVLLKNRRQVLLNDGF